jgi:glycosyltransferase involved in cell wall biosynthesis
MKPIISIIVPVYNVEIYLNQCIDSLLHQTHKDFELILVDDGSTDRSGSICDSYKEIDKRIIVIHKKNGGLSSARNAGIEISKGTYIAFVDSDDWIHPDMYYHLLNSLLESKADIALGRLNKVSQNKSFFYSNYSNDKSNILSKEILITKLLKYEIDSSSCSKLFNSKLFKNDRFPVGITNEDFALLYKLFLNSNFGVTNNFAIYNYRDREGSITNSTSNKFIIDEYLNALDMVKFINNQSPTLTPIAKSYLFKKLHNVLTSFLTKKLINKSNYSFIHFKKDLNYFIPEIIINSYTKINTKLKLILIFISPFLYQLLYKLKVIVFLKSFF